MRSDSALRVVPELSCFFSADWAVSGEIRYTRTLKDIRQIAAQQLTSLLLSCLVRQSLASGGGNDQSSNLVPVRGEDDSAMGL
jgi:hypothetical protein